MKESVTYQAIIEEGEAKGLSRGKVEGARKLLYLFGREQLGEPSASVQAALNAVTDVGMLEELALRLKHVSSWEELVGRNGASLQ